MAGSTILAGSNMTRALASRGCAIVTARTAPAYAGMIEARGRPTSGTVAGVAILGGRQMRRCLAHGLNPVVAGRAAFRHAGVVELADGPLPRRVAGVAGRFGPEMCGGFADGANRIVAIGADLGRIRKLAIFMAGNAVDFSVGARKRKTGFEMVEAIARRSILSKRLRCGEKRDRKKQ